MLLKSSTSDANKFLIQFIDLMLTGATQNEAIWKVAMNNNVCFSDVIIAVHKWQSKKETIGERLQALAERQEA